MQLLMLRQHLLQRANILMKLLCLCETLLIKRTDDGRETDLSYIAQEVFTNEYLEHQLSTSLLLSNFFPVMIQGFLNSLPFELKNSVNIKSFLNSCVVSIFTINLQLQ